jgi:hypothetical protein
VTLCEFEVKVLRVCAGEAVPGMAWGAAMGQALECLEGARLVARKAGVYSATDQGRAYLADMRGAG